MKKNKNKRWHGENALTVGGTVSLFCKKIKEGMTRAELGLHERQREEPDLEPPVARSSPGLPCPWESVTAVSLVLTPFAVCWLRSRHVT